MDREITITTKVPDDCSNEMDLLICLEKTMEYFSGFCIDSEIKRATEWLYHKYHKDTEVEQ